MYERVHDVRGRLRVRVHGLKNCPSRAADLESTLAAMPGINAVECRTVTGSVILHYRPGVTDIEAVLRSLGCERLPAAHTFGSQPFANQLGSRVLRAVLSFAFERAAERALFALLAAAL